MVVLVIGCNVYLLTLPTINFHGGATGVAYEVKSTVLTYLSIP